MSLIVAQKLFILLLLLLLLLLLYLGEMNVVGINGID
jgi:hypothetical protein